MRVLTTRSANLDTGGDRIHSGSMNKTKALRRGARLGMDPTLSQAGSRGYVVAVRVLTNRLSYTTRVLAMRGDWEKVGRDIYAAMDRYQRARAS